MTIQQRFTWLLVGTVAGAASVTASFLAGMQR